MPTVFTFHPVKFTPYVMSRPTTVWNPVGEELSRGGRPLIMDVEALRGGERQLVLKEDNEFYVSMSPALQTRFSGLPPADPGSHSHLGKIAVHLTR